MSKLIRQKETLDTLAVRMDKFEVRVDKLAAHTDSEIEKLARSMQNQFEHAEKTADKNTELILSHLTLIQADLTDIKTTNKGFVTSEASQDIEIKNLDTRVTRLERKQGLALA